MMSKNSSFKGQIAYCLEGLHRRLWSCAMSALVFFFAFPVASAMIISNARQQMSYQAELFTPAMMELFVKKMIFRNYQSYAGPGSVPVVLVMALMAVVCAVSGFHWLFMSKETDFYHSLPIRRERLFGTVTIDSILITAIPYGVMSLISAFIMMAATGRKYVLWIAFTGYLFHMTVFLFCYAVAVAAVMLTGQTVVCLLGTAVFYGIGPMIVGAVSMLFSGYFDSFYDGRSGVFEALRHSSPVLWAAMAGIGDMGSRIIGTAGGRFVGTAVWSLVWFAVLTALGLILYRKRPSEAAGHAIAFRWARPVIKVVLSASIGIFAGAFIHEIMVNTEAVDAWTVFAAACGVLLTALILEIIYHADFKKLFAGKRSLLLAAVITAAVLAFFRFDLAGYDRWLPAPDKVASAGICCDALEGDAWQYQTELVMEQNEVTGRHYVNTVMRGAGTFPDDYRARLADETVVSDPETVRVIAQQGIRDIKDPALLEAQGRPAAVAEPYTINSTAAGTAEYAAAEPENQTRLGQVLVSWRLTNGRTVYRQYLMNLSAVREELDSVHDDASWKQAMYPNLLLDPEELSEICYNLGGRCWQLTDSSQTARAKKILEAWKADMLELTAETQREEMPALCLQFRTKRFREIADIMMQEDPYAVETFNNFGYYPVYPSFKRTMALLKECGLPVEDTLQADKVFNLEIFDYRSWYGGEQDYTGTKNQGSVLIEDPEEIREILEAAQECDLVCGNSYGSRYSGLEIQARYPAGTFMVEGAVPAGGTASSPEYTREVRYGMTSQYDTRILYFHPDRIPQSVREKFGITDEDIRMESYRNY